MKVSSLTKQYGEKTVVDSVSFEKTKKKVEKCEHGKFVLSLDKKREIP